MIIYVKENNKISKTEYRGPLYSPIDFSVQYLIRYDNQWIDINLINNDNYFSRDYNYILHLYKKNKTGILINILVK